MSRCRTQDIEAGEGIEPSHGGFADRIVTTSTSGHFRHYFTIYEKD
ncbi:MAG: hypothetical protein ACD_40C00026G0001 [uncultured bacterium]|nr:MAG: hypothetical protein ACD_40C00026G0001 [uncultured bacterium]